MNSQKPFQTDISDGKVEIKKPWPYKNKIKNWNKQLKKNYKCTCKNEYRVGGGLEEVNEILHFIQKKKQKHTENAIIFKGYDGIQLLHKMKYTQTI